MTSTLDIPLIVSLDNTEQSWWEGEIKEFRKKYIRDPKSYVFDLIKTKGISIDDLKRNIETYIEEFRESVWQKYLIDEANFHREIIAHLIQTRQLPRDILMGILQKDFFDRDFTSLSQEEALTEIARIVGDCSGRVMPYIYALSLSTTQSRRARAGKVFEKIMESFFDVFEYPYGNQSAIATVAHSLGKKVDLLVPSVEAYIQNRPKCAVVTMKTSLRERWQEVAEELSRTNVPHIYLLTVDPNVTTNTVSLIKQYNITLVLYKKDKTKRFSGHSNVMDYEEFFLKEIPHIINYWSTKND